MAEHDVPKDSLDQRLSKIRSSPKLQSQQQSAIILAAVEETLKSQKSEFTPTAYFAALLSLLTQHVSSSSGTVNKDVSTATVYLLELVTPHVPAALLRSKFSAIVTCLGPALTLSEADAPFVRSSIGCLISLLLVQDAQSWALPQHQLGPRQALGGLLGLAVDPRPKIRKRAQEGLATVLRNPPPSPSLDHPAADMCAETSLQRFEDLSASAEQARRQRKEADSPSHDPALIHTMQLIKTVALASGGWPTRNLDSLCEILFKVAKSKAEFLTMAAFDVFEAILEGMAKSETFEKLPRLLDAIIELRPSQDDTQLLPPWLAVVSRAYDVSAQVEPEETFQKLPDLFDSISAFLASSSYNIRVSASECLISLFVNCVPPTAILEPSVYDEKTIGKLSKALINLFSVKFQASWMEVFNVATAAFDAFRWASYPSLGKVVATVGELRGNESFAGKQQADEVLKSAISAMGPEQVLQILPLNLLKPAPNAPGRAWMLPLLRDSVSNTNLSHFRKELVPLSEALYQRVLDKGGKDKSMETKIFETVVQQIWATLPGYCDHPLDIVQSFDQEFAESLAKLLYQQPEMRTILTKSLQNLVDSMKVIAEIEGNDDSLLQGRITKVDAQNSIRHLSSFTSNLLAILFNVYAETLPQSRGTILSCIDSYLSIMEEKDLSDTFNRVATTLEGCIKEEIAQRENQAKTKPTQQEKSAQGPMSHSLMDIVVVIALYLPRESFSALFNIAAVIISQNKDPQLQKKAYKLIPRLGSSERGVLALTEQNAELRKLMLENAEMLMGPAKRDRLSALLEIVKRLPDQDLSFLPNILPEVILCTKDSNERARNTAFDLIVEMGRRMQTGGIIVQPDGSEVSATIDEFFTMLSAGLERSSPHLTSASVTAIARALYEFRRSLSENVLRGLVSNIDPLLKSLSREIVRSVLGFVKVCIISLPATMIEPRLPTLIPALMTWSHEHKGHFRIKVKGLLERLIRRFGAGTVERHCPQEDRKLIVNIRKTRERRKRKKTAAADGDENVPEKRQSKFESEYDEAIYGSDEEDNSSMEGISSDEEVEGGVSLRAQGKSAKKSSKNQQAYILEDDEEPLDLLDRKSLARISTTKPQKLRQPPQRKQRARTNMDGKLVLGEEEGEERGDADMQDTGKEPGDGTLEGGINAYIAAIRGRDAAQRGQRGRLKFSNKRSNGADEMELDEDDDGKEAIAKRSTAARGGRGGPRGNSGTGRGGRFQSKFARGKMQRRGLGVDKTRGGRVMKGGASPRGKRR